MIPVRASLATLKALPYIVSLTEGTLRAAVRATPPFTWQAWLRSKRQELSSYASLFRENNGRVIWCKHFVL